MRNKPNMPSSKVKHWRGEVIGGSHLCVSVCEREGESNVASLCQCSSSKKQLSVSGAAHKLFKYKHLLTPPPLPLSFSLSCSHSAKCILRFWLHFFLTSRRRLSSCLWLTQQHKCVSVCVCVCVCMYYSILTLRQPNLINTRALLSIQT